MATSKKRNRASSHGKVSVCACMETCKKSWRGGSRCAKNKCRDYKDPLDPKNKKK